MISPTFRFLNSLSPINSEVAKIASDLAPTSTRTSFLPILTTTPCTRSPGLNSCNFILLPSSNLLITELSILTFEDFDTLGLNSKKYGIKASAVQFRRMGIAYGSARHQISLKFNLLSPLSRSRADDSKEDKRP